MKAKIRGTEIYFDVAGMQLAPIGQDFEERPVLFLLHGGPGQDHLRFKQHSLALQDVAQLIFVDNRGCGRSKKTKKSEYTLENNIEDIEALRKYLGLEKINVLGTSYGGIVAQGYAIRYSKHVDKLILVATTSQYQAIEDAQKYLDEHASPEQIAIAKHLWNGTFKSHDHVMDFFTLFETVYSVTAKPKKRKPKPPKIHTVWSHEALNEGFGNFLRKLNLTPKLKKIKCPTLVLGGDKDWILPAKYSKIIAENIPNSELKIFKNCGHAIGVDAGPKYLKAVKKFLKTS